MSDFSTATTQEMIVDYLPRVTTTQLLPLFRMGEAHRGAGREVLATFSPQYSKDQMRVLYFVDDDILRFEWVSPKGNQRAEIVGVEAAERPMGKVYYFLCGNDRSHRASKLYYNGESLRGRLEVPSRYSYQNHGRVKRTYSGLPFPDDFWASIPRRHKTHYRGRPTPTQKRIERYEARERRSLWAITRHGARRIARARLQE